MKKIFIAEIKTKSPFGYQSPHSFTKLMDVALEYGDWISVHDNALWGGDSECISFVRKYTNKPILAKGFHSTRESIQRALDHGADKVLTFENFDGHFSADTIVREIETKHPKNTWGLSSGYVQIIINSRNLKNGNLINGFEKQITSFKEMGFKVFHASNIKTKQDVHPDADGFIVGTNLIEFVKTI